VEKVTTMTTQEIGDYASSIMQQNINRYKPQQVEEQK
jgi:hypothetical protein